MKKGSNYLPGFIPGAIVRSTWHRPGAALYPRCSCWLPADQSWDEDFFSCGLAVSNGVDELNGEPMTYVVAFGSQRPGWVYSDALVLEEDTSW